MPLAMALAVQRVSPIRHRAKKSAMEAERSGILGNATSGIWNFGMASSARKTLAHTIKKRKA